MWSYLGVFGSPDSDVEHFLYSFYNTSLLVFSLGFYTELLYLLERFRGSIFYIFAGVEIMTIWNYSFCDKRFLNSFWWPWRLLGLLGGSLGSLLFLAGLGCLFHCFGRCPNHDDFLWLFIRQSAPRLILASLGLLGLLRASLCSPPLWLH